jgi:DNA-binding NarL/FixJ family response regulator
MAVPQFTPVAAGGIWLRYARLFISPIYKQAWIVGYRDKCVALFVFFPDCSYRVSHGIMRRGGAMTTRVLLADDHLLFAQTMTALLAERYEVVDVVGDGRALQASARKHQPDVIVTDITMPFMSGLESVRALRKAACPSKVVFLTMHVDSELARECLNCGGSAFVNKESGFEELVEAIEAVMTNHQYLSPKIAAGLIEAARDSAAGPTASEQMTSRQREILQLFAEGKTMKEIASITNLSTRTVEWHKYKMMKMLGTRHSAELIQHAVKLKLVI